MFGVHSLGHEIQEAQTDADIEAAIRAEPQVYRLGLGPGTRRSVLPLSFGRILFSG
jgi:hypothetical protein